MKQSFAIYFILIGALMFGSNGNGEETAVLPDTAVPTVQEVVEKTAVNLTEQWQLKGFPVWQP